MKSGTIQHCHFDLSGSLTATFKIQGSTRLPPITASVSGASTTRAHSFSTPIAYNTTIVITPELQSSSLNTLALYLLLCCLSPIMAELKRVRESISSDEATPATSQQQEHQQQPSAAAVVTAPAPNLSRRRVCPVGGSLHKSVNQYLYKSSAVKHAAAVQLGQRRSIFPTGCVWVLHQPTYAWDCQLTLYILAVTCRLAEQDTAEEALQLLQEHEGRLLEVLVVGTSVLTATATAARLSFPMISHTHCPPNLSYQFVNLCRSTTSCALPTTQTRRCTKRP